jgi:hypothetical protein
MGEFSGCSSDTAVDPVTDEALPTPSAELLSGAPDHNFVRADGQSHVIIKLIRIRLRVNLPPKRPQKRPQKTNIVLRLKGLKHGKGARERRKKARRSG